MNTITILLGILGLLLLSSFFSGSETGMMSLNRYKLRNAAKRNRNARRSQSLLKRPDRLLGVILIGNTFANILASSMVAIYAESRFGQAGVFIATIILTFIVLIFAEIIPKTIAALYPEKVAFSASMPLKALLLVFYPIVWLLNIIANSILLFLGIKVSSQKDLDPLSKEEIHSVVHESSSSLTHKHKNMLLGVLELESIKISDVMIPRHKIEAIDISNVDAFIDNVINSSHSRLLIYHKELDNLLGILHIKKAIPLINNSKAATIEDIKNILIEPYYVPDSVTLQTQLLKFQQKGCRFSVAVDEYGSVVGVISLEDIVEEIVGEFSDTFELEKLTKKSKDGSYLVLGSITMRELKRHTRFDFDNRNSKTLSGLIIDYLEEIPDGQCSFKINGYIIEVVSIQSNMIYKARISPIS
jgi:Mg2+/Co2+ transporter CorB